MQVTMLSAVSSRCAGALLPVLLLFLLRAAAVVSMWECDRSGGAGLPPLLQCWASPAAPSCAPPWPLPCPRPASRPCESCCAVLCCAPPPTQPFTVDTCVRSTFYFHTAHSHTLPAAPLVNAGISLLPGAPWCFLAAAAAPCVPPAPATLLGAAAAPRLLSVAAAPCVCNPLLLQHACMHAYMVQLFRQHGAAGAWE